MDIIERKRIKGKHIKRHPWESARLKFITYILSKQKEKFEHILDVGSGDVYVLNNLAQRHFASHYTGVDTAFTFEVIEDLNTDPAIQLLKEIPESIKPTSDCILLLDVLEHCENDQSVLESLKDENIVQQNAIFLITVPAFQTLFGGHDIALGHYRRYNIGQLKQLVSHAGLKEIESGYFFFTLLFLRFLQLITGKLFKKKSGKTIDNWNGNILLTKLLEFILIFDFRIGRFFKEIGIQIPGLSAYCLCKA
jgi:hypothetical protein